MERLTTDRYPYLEAFDHCTNGCTELCELARSSADNETDPCYICDIGKAIKKLSVFEQAEQEGRLVALPCKVGDTVYAYCDVFHRVLAYFIEQVIIDYSDINEVLITFNANCTEGCELMDSIDFGREDIGKTVFLTREKAEKALKEGENK